MQTLPFSTNFFADEPRPARTAALTEDGTADVVIVGAGIVGLSCAYVLREAGLEVAVVERDHVGFASSGRHMGHLTPHMWNYGSNEPHVLAAWAHGCLDWIEELLAREDIDCDFARCPFWLPAATEAEAEVVRRVAGYYAGLGVPARSVPAEDFDLVTFRTWGAVVLQDQARAHPYRMVRGLRDAVLRKGVRLYEGTPVTSVEGGPRVTVTTPGGTLRAPKAVLALNAYSGQFPFLRGYCTPTRSSPNPWTKTRPGPSVLRAPGTSSSTTWRPTGTRTTSTSACGETGASSSAAGAPRRPRRPTAWPRTATRRSSATSTRRCSGATRPSATCGSKLLGRTHLRDRPRAADRHPSSGTRERRDGDSWATATGSASEPTPGGW